MYTVIETPIFEEGARKIWSEDEWNTFFSLLAADPEVGDAIPGSGGCRKVRWFREHTCSHPEVDSRGIGK